MSFKTKIDKTLNYLPKSTQKIFKQALDGKKTTYEVFIPHNYSENKSLIQGDILRNKLYFFQKEYQTSLNFYNDIHKDTNNFSIGYNSIIKKKKEKIYNKHDKDKAENVCSNEINKYKNLGYNSNNLFPKSNIFNKSLLLEQNEDNYVTILKEVDKNDIKKDKKYFEKLEKKLKVYKTLDNYKEQMNKRNSYLIEHNKQFINENGIKNLPILTQRTQVNTIEVNEDKESEMNEDILSQNEDFIDIKKNIKTLEDDINLTKNTLLNLDKFDITRKNFYNTISNSKSYTTNINSNSGKKKRKKKIKIKNQKKNISPLPIQIIDKRKSQLFFGNNKEKAFIFNPKNIISKRISNLYNDDYSKIYFQTFKTEIENKIKSSREEKHYQDALNTYNKIKELDYINGEKEAIEYMKKYNQKIPEKIKKFNGSNLYGFTRNFKTKTSKTNIPELMNNLRFKLGDYSIGGLKIEKEKEIDKKISTIDLDCIDDILKLNDDLIQNE